MQIYIKADVSFKEKLKGLIWHFYKKDCLLI